MFGFGYSYSRAGSGAACPRDLSCTSIDRSTSECALEACRISVSVRVDSQPLRYDRAIRHIAIGSQLWLQSSVFPYSRTLEQCPSRARTRESQRVPLRVPRVPHSRDPDTIRQGVLRLRSRRYRWSREHLSRTPASRTCEDHRVAKEVWSEETRRLPDVARRYHLRIRALRA
jgi:hypothetical protein